MKTNPTGGGGLASRFVCLIVNRFCCRFTLFCFRSHRYSSVNRRSGTNTERPFATGQHVRSIFRFTPDCTFKNIRLGRSLHWPRTTTTTTFLVFFGRSFSLATRTRGKFFISPRKHCPSTTEHVETYSDRLSTTLATGCTIKNYEN